MPLSVHSVRILEGEDIRKVIGMKESAIMEALVKAEDLDSFYKSSAYKVLDKNAAALLKKAEAEDGYRKGPWTKEPMESVEDEVDEFFFALEHLKQLKLDGFPEDARKKAEAILTTAQRSYNRVLIKLKQNDTPEKVTKQFQPLFYTKKALTLYYDFFETLGIEWDYVWPFYNTEREPKVADMNFEGKERVSIQAKFRGYFDWISGLYEKYGVTQVRLLVSEKIRSIESETDRSLFISASKLF